MADEKLNKIKQGDKVMFWKPKDDSNWKTMIDNFNVQDEKVLAEEKDKKHQERV